MLVRLLALSLLTGCATTSSQRADTSAPVAEPAWLREHDGGVDLRGRNIIFVAGFGNELIPGYFADNAEVCRALGAETTLLTPPSTGGLDADVQLIERELAFRRGVPAILFGHSKGGAGVLLTALRNAERLLSGEIEAVVVVQGAVGGSPLADLVGWFPLASKGLKDLTTARARALFGKALTDLDAQLSPEDRARVFSRIFYVRSARAGRPVAAELGLTELLLRAHGPNDGLLVPSDMRLSQGVDLGVVDADHASLTVSSFLAISTAEERKAFTLALFREIQRRRADAGERPTSTGAE